MNKKPVGFWISWSALTFFLTLAIKYLQLPSAAYFILMIITLATGFIFYRMTKSSPNKFVHNYLLSIVLKLLVGGILISIVIISDKPHSGPSVMFFCISYLLFTSLEVGFLLKLPPLIKN